GPCEESGGSDAGGGVEGGAEAYAGIEPAGSRRREVHRLDQRRPGRGRAEGERGGAFEQHIGGKEEQLSREALRVDDDAPRAGRQNAAIGGLPAKAAEAFVGV